MDKLDNIFHRFTFISFNYDRCLELFLFDALRQSYGIDPKRAADICNTAKIFHPYGVVGTLPHENKTTSVPFGNESENNYLEMAGRIRTYTEEITDHNQLDDINNVVSNADLIVFLGFGFHRQNLDILANGDKAKSMHKDILATGWGISPSNCYKHNEDIKSGFSCNESYVYHDKRCFELLNSLSARIFV